MTSVLNGITVFEYQKNIPSIWCAIVHNVTATDRTRF